MDLSELYIYFRHADFSESAIPDSDLPGTDTRDSPQIANEHLSALHVVTMSETWLKDNPHLLPLRLCSEVMHGPYSGSQGGLYMLSVRPR